MTAATVDPTKPGRSPALGIVTFVVAVLAYLGIPALIAAAGSLGLVPAGGPVSAELVVPLVVFATIALVAILAAVTRRGRGWAIAALVIAVANNHSPIHEAIADLIRAIFG